MKMKNMYIVDCDARGLAEGEREKVRRAVERLCGARGGSGGDDGGDAAAEPCDAPDTIEGCLRCGCRRCQNAITCMYSTPSNAYRAMAANAAPSVDGGGPRRAPPLGGWNLSRRRPARSARAQTSDGRPVRKTRSDSAYSDTALRCLEMARTIVVVDFGGRADGPAAADDGLPRRWIFYKTDAHGAFHTRQKVLLKRLSAAYGCSCIAAARAAADGRARRDRVMRALANSVGKPTTLVRFPPESGAVDIDKIISASWLPTRQRR